MSQFSDALVSLDSVQLGTGTKDVPAVALKIAPTAASNLTTLTNAAVGQATTITLPDPGAATANILLDTGSAASVTATTVSAGKSGTAGSVKVFPATASRGDLKITCANQTGNTEVVLTAAVMGQASTLTLPDPGTATANICEAPAALISNNYVIASGTSGLIADGMSGTAVVTMNTAAVTGAFATPVQIVAAPGTGKALLVLNAIIYTKSTGQTAFATGGVAVLQFGNTANGAGVNALTGTIPAANITSATTQTINFAGSTTALALASNNNVGLFFSNQTGAFTNGTGSTVAVQVEYMVVTL